MAKRGSFSLAVISILILSISHVAPSGPVEIVSPDPVEMEHFGTRVGRFGESIALIPDRSGDGLPDIAIGAPEEIMYLGSDKEGKIYVFEGRTGILLETLVSPDSISSRYSLPNFGGFFTGIEDLDGDHLGEILVGAPMDTLHDTLPEAGRALMFLSSDRLSADLNSDGVIDHLDLMIF